MPYARPMSYDFIIILNSDYKIIVDGRGSFDLKDITKGKFGKIMR